MSGTYSQAAAADRLDASAADGLVERERERTTREKGKEREVNRDREGEGEGDTASYRGLTDHKESKPLLCPKGMRHRGGSRGWGVRVKVSSSSDLLLRVGRRRGFRRERGGDGVPGKGGERGGEGKRSERGEAERGREEGSR